jgi:hypothetical protein
MTDLRYTPAIEEIGHDEACSLAAHRPLGQILPARMFVRGRMAMLRQRRNSETLAQPESADVPA